MEEIHYSNSKHKKSGVVTLMLDKIDFKTGDEEGNFIMTKGTVSGRHKYSCVCI